MRNLIDEVARRDEERHRLAKELVILRSTMGEMANTPVALVVMNYVHARYLHHFGQEHWEELLDALLVVMEKSYDGEALTAEDIRGLDGWIPAIMMDSTTMPDVVVFAFLETLNNLRAEVQE